MSSYICSQDLDDVFSCSCCYHFSGHSILHMVGKLLKSGVENLMCQSSVVASAIPVLGLIVTTGLLVLPPNALDKVTLVSASVVTSC